MANFKTHVAGGIIVGLGFSSIGYLSFNLDLIQSFAIFTIGLLGGIIPDLDSDSGKPLALISGSLSVLLPALLLNKVTTPDKLSPEFLISYFAFSYFLINYIACELIKKFTVHRGIMHSIPFSFLVAEVTYLLFTSSGQKMATMASLALFFGCLVHLILDELNAFYFKFGFIPLLNKSSGTALKLYSSGFLINIFIYSLVFGVAFIIFNSVLFL
jgi:membrane-bound metal-dependent hydrolase YbcI (DUF457 family)